MKRFAIIVSAAVAMGALGTGMSTARPAADGTVNVRARNYEYRNVPSKMNAGKTTFNFKNMTNKRMHEFVLLKNNSKHSPREILNMPEEKALKKVKMMGATWAKPGKTGKPLKADLKAGKYFAVCFVQNDDDKPSHWRLGMITKFKVVE